MAGYLVACVTWNDTDALKRYGEIVRESLKPFGGRYIIRGPVHSVAEGSSAPARLAVVEFPSVNAAKQWHESEAYRPGRKIREESATTHWLVFIHGV